MLVSAVLADPFLKSAMQFLIFVEKVHYSFREGEPIMKELLLICACVALPCIGMSALSVFREIAAQRIEDELAHVAAEKSCENRAKESAERLNVDR